jgi:hypothetical protein
MAVAPLDGLVIEKPFCEILLGGSGIVEPELTPEEPIGEAVGIGVADEEDPEEAREAGLLKRFPDALKPPQLLKRRSKLAVIIAQALNRNDLLIFRLGLYDLMS